MGDGTSRGGTASLDVVIEEVRTERTAQLEHFDALDAKAGVLLGFSGVLAALAPSSHVVAGIGRLFAVTAAVMALSVFRPRKFPVVDLYTLRERYLGANPRFTKLVLLDTRLEMLEVSAALLRSKAKRLTWAMISMVAAVALIAAAIPLH